MPSRYLIGIDLGTTNSVVAYIDTRDQNKDTHDHDKDTPDKDRQGRAGDIHVFPVPQVVAHGEVQTLPALPSFLYFPTEEELASGSVIATWEEEPPMITGVLAREQGALVPARQVSSAKSWLSYAGVDRRAPILPPQQAKSGLAGDPGFPPQQAKTGYAGDSGSPAPAQRQLDPANPGETGKPDSEAASPRISPVEASARYLMHLRDAWNNSLGAEMDARFESQEIVLTVPASFNEEARELTVEAARRAGLENLTLLEEPLAAFYAWIAARQPPGKPGATDNGAEDEDNDPPVENETATLRDGELILICDIGGGTTDFSLVRARRADRGINGVAPAMALQAPLAFERTAIGEHLLLGGDNLDFALARLVEEKLKANTKLTLRQRYALRRACSAAKERLLGGSGDVPSGVPGNPVLGCWGGSANRDSSADVSAGDLIDGTAQQPQSVPITILGSGRAVVGQALRVDLTRAEVVQLLTSGFLPLTPPEGTSPKRGRATGLRELGLPYAADPAITRHLAAFLRQAAVAMNIPADQPVRHEYGKAPASEEVNYNEGKNGSHGIALARPDAVLFNGGFCTPPLTRARIMEAISSWFQPRTGQSRGSQPHRTAADVPHNALPKTDSAQAGAAGSWRPKLLYNRAVDSAVARGAAYYGRVRRGAGLRIQAGSARSYYIALETAEIVSPAHASSPGTSPSRLEAICILPAGTDEGISLPPLNHEFSVLANRPVSFALYSSHTRHHRHGELVVLDEAQVHRHAPLVAVLRYGKKLREVQVAVRLRAIFTEVGTLELWCEARDTPHRWRLQFELRGSHAEAEYSEVQPGSAQARSVIDSTVRVASASSRERGVALIREVFGPSAAGETSPETLTNNLEAALGIKRDAWPAAVTRRFSDVLAELGAARNQSPRHEVRWLNLLGFCLRPGFGMPGDEERVHHLHAAASELVFAGELQGQVERMAALRRIAGGLNASLQQALYRQLQDVLRPKKGRINRQLEYEAWRLVASLEHLPAATRASLGQELLAKLRREPADAIWLWSLGRLGARIPLYAPLHSVVAPKVAGEWLNAVLDVSELATLSAAAITALALMARHTDDPARDVDENGKRQVISRLTALRAGADVIPLVSKNVPPERADAVRTFGESLPPGLELVTSATCLLSVAALRTPSLSRRA